MTLGSVPNDLLDLAYGTATNPGLWPKFCEALNRLSGSPIKLIGHNIASGQNIGFLSAGWDPDFLARYRAYYGALNPWMHMNLALQTGDVGVSDKALPRAELIKTEFYNDWLRPQEGIIAGPAMMCHRSHDKFVLLVAASRAKDAERTLEANVDLFQQLAPHLSRALVIGRALADARGKQGLQLDPSRYAVAYIRRSGQTDFADQEAEHVFRDLAGVHVGVRGQMTAAREDVRQFLKHSIHAMTEQDYSSLPPPVAVQSKALGVGLLQPHIVPSDTEHGFPLVCWSNPIVGAFVLTSRRQLGDQGGREEALYDLACALGATPAEARLAQAVAMGERLSTFAARTGVSPATARNQMQALLHKTGTRSQAQFVSHILSLWSPLRKH
ncbi:MAG: hypothetical protein AAGF48_05150 [Pseudomonadota bacterium]